MSTAPEAVAEVTYTIRCSVRLVVEASVAMGRVVLYMTSTPTTLKLKHDIKRVQELLAAKNIQHEEVKKLPVLLLSLGSHHYFVAVRLAWMCRSTSHMNPREEQI